MTSWLAEALAASSMLMVLVLLVRRQVAAWFGPRWAYLLWLMPALRMALPRLPGPAPTFRTVGFEMHRGGPLVVHPMPLTPGLSLPSSASPPGLPEPFAWGEAVLAIWLAGAAIFFTLQMIAYRRFLRRALAGATFISRDCGISVYSSDAADGPVAAGILLRYIFLPRDFTSRFDVEERKLALAHEVAHHVRGDLVANLGALALLSLHWFNPIAHIAFRAFRADQELACDGTVLADAPAADRYPYGSAILKSAWGATPAAACALNRTSQIKRRLKMMGRQRRGLARSLSGAALAAALVGGGLLLTASHGGPSAPMPPTAPAAHAVSYAPDLLPATEAPPALQARHAPIPPAPPPAPRPGRAPRPVARRAVVAAALAAAEEARRTAAEAEVMAAEAQAEAQRTIAGIDVQRRERTALAAARAGLAASCRDPAAAQRAASLADDRAAIDLLARDCTDMAQIRAEVARTLARAHREIARNVELSAAERERALSAVDAELARSR